MVFPANFPNPIAQAIKKYYSENLENNHMIIKTKNIYNLKGKKDLTLFINFEKTNNFRQVNKFHEIVNLILIPNGIYCSCAETINQRSDRKWKKSRFFLGPIVLFIDFLYKRVIPKLPFTKQIYFALTRGHNRVMSKTEILGRLVSCGFESLEIIKHENLSYIISKKVRTPLYDMHPSYGPIFKMKRVGKNGKIISVYKFRTMSPYSEYIQGKIIQDNKLDKGGKIKDDFRITFYGKFLRKYWIDELPMIINWIKRDLKIVGVRPLSEDYFGRYPKDLQELRIKTKPGLVPPYYVDLPVTFEEICDSERKYLIQYFKNPIKTDFNYFFKAAWNILIKRNRSR
jgi:lipopolysaccharide/colanic/teichoic acid biosynthesis glycosyltransferase